MTTQQALPQHSQLAFSQSLREAHALLDSLSQLLEQESQALRTQDADGITSILSDKSDLLKALEDNAQRRSELLDSSSYSVDEAGTQRFLKAMPANTSSAMQAEWDALKQKLKQCQASNQVNGKIVNRSKQQVDTLINLIRGQSANPNLYSSSGATAAMSRQQPIAKA